MKLLTFVAVLFSLPLVAFSAGDEHDLLPARWLPMGAYGGHAATFNVVNRAADLDLPCAHGHIPYRPVLNSFGSFVAEGTWESGPIARPGTPRAHATFRGRLMRGGLLSLQVTVHDRGRIQQLSFQQLQLGHTEFFVRCL